MFLTLLLLASLAVAPISIKVQAHYLIAAEVKFRVELIIPVDKANRMAMVEWEGEGEHASEGATSRQLDEFTDWTRHTFYILLTPGKYSIRGRLIQANGKEKVTPTKTVEILSAIPQSEQN